MVLSIAVIDINGKVRFTRQVPSGGIAPLIGVDTDGDGIDEAGVKTKGGMLFYSLQTPAQAPTLFDAIKPFSTAITAATLAARDGSFSDGVIFKDASQAISLFSFRDGSLVNTYLNARNKTLVKN